MLDRIFSDNCSGDNMAKIEVVLRTINVKIYSSQHELKEVELGSLLLTEAVEYRLALVPLAL